jgi:lipopolysaccharide transport system permease protein
MSLKNKVHVGASNDGEPAHAQQFASPAAPPSQLTLSVESPGMIEELQELWRFRELLLTMVHRELRVRYKNSFLGILWSFVSPLVTTVVMWLVFSVFMNNGIHNYSAYYLAAFLPFAFLQQSTLDASQSVLSALPIVKKVYFPRELLPLSVVISNFIHLLLGFVVLFAYLLVVYIRFPGSFPIQPTVIYLPLLLIITLTFATGMALLSCALNTFYEDVKYLVTVGMYLMLFCCPIMYFVEMVANSKINREPYFWVYKLYNLNPFAALCIAFRKTILAPTPVLGRDGIRYAAIPLDWNYVLAAGLISVATLVLGYSTFNRLKWRFVERP